MAVRHIQEDGFDDGSAARGFARDFRVSITRPVRGHLDLYKVLRRTISTARRRLGAGGTEGIAVNAASLAHGDADHTATADVPEGVDHLLAAVLIYETGSC